MRNPVVTTAAAAYYHLGISTLRFNFRGVGKSSGSYDNGNGEQKDVIGAINWLKDKGICKIHLVGYSFGAWINALVVAEGCVAADMVMISPPVAFIKFPTPLTLPSLSLVITGQHDEIAPPAQIETLIGGWNTKANLKVLSATDHFMFNVLPALESVLSEHLNKIIIY
jgi:hypothetical protein